MAKQMMDIGLVPVRDGDGNEIGEDLAIAEGDFAVVESTAQHQQQLLLDAPGEFKQNPTICVGVPIYEDDEGPSNLIKAIVQQFMGDGMEVDNLNVNTADLPNDIVQLFPNAYYPG